MARYILTRLVDSFFVAFLALSAVFFVLYLSGDPVVLVAPLDTPPAELARLRTELGLDRPLLLQYLDFISSAARGDFGTSLRRGDSAIAVVLERVPNSLLLAASSLALTLSVAIPLGVASALKRNSLLDRAATTLAVVGQAVPNFWLGLMLILVFSVQLRLLPTGGMGSWKHLIMPSLTLAAYSAARVMRLTRSSMLQELRMDYVRTARAKGLAERLVVWKHVFRNAAQTVITITGLQLGVIFSGSVVTETIFAWPGIGRLLVDSISFRDFPVVRAAVFVIALLYSFLNLVVDITHAYLNPAIRYD